MIGGITVLSLGAWWLPFGLGGRYWFKGCVRTISEEEVRKAKVVDDDSSFEMGDT